MPQDDLTNKEYWGRIYEDYSLGTNKWQPVDYNALTLEYILLTEIKRSKPKHILEIGCGNSVWLPYLARKTGANVYGIDYSEQGCQLAKQRLEVEGVDGKILCADFFRASPSEIGCHDFVFSLGVVEHYSDPMRVLAKLLEFVNPGGVLLTEIPNYNWMSIHGILKWLWQPDSLAKHNMMTKKDLISTYKYLGLQEVRGHYMGLFSLNMLPWEIDPRWPTLARRTIPWIRKISSCVDKALKRINYFGGIAPFAPFIYVTGLKSINTK